MNKTVYFDNNATTQVAPEVREAMMPFFGELYGNPSSMHFFGGQVASYVTKAREEVAAFLNCEPDEVYFTSCATESDNTIDCTFLYPGNASSLLPTGMASR